MQLSFLGRRALVTGGSRGIGEAVASVLRSLGAEVVVTGRSLSGDAPPSDPGIGRSRREAVDFSSLRDTEAFASRMAGEGIDILVNNAGTNRVAPSEEVETSEWEDIFSVNLRAPFVLCRALAPRMAARGYGRIVNVSSIFASVTRRGRAAYTSSKAGLTALTRTLAVEYSSRGVLVNAVAPGFVETRMTRKNLAPEERKQLLEQVPLARMGRPEEIARVVAFLASSENSFMTGQEVIVDGGFTLS
ncbi:MAG: SDR family NAD(P)-dependent oxidoreductase [Myxococcota bacterium]